MIYKKYLKVKYIIIFKYCRKHYMYHLKPPILNKRKYPQIV